jgi:multiple RNA-binding domain-containing protein 1
LTISGIVDKERSKHKETKSSDNIENDPQLNEFLEVMQPRNKAKLWANDTTISNAAKSETGSKLGRLEKQRGEVSGKKPALEVKTVEGVLRRVPIGKGKGGDQLLQTHLRYEDDDDEYEEAPVLDLEVEGTTAHSGADPKDLMTLDKDPIVENAAVSDLDYMKARVKGGDWSSDDEGNADADETNFRKESSKSESETSCSEGEEEEEEDHEEDVHMTDAPTKVVIAKEDSELKDDAGIRNRESQIRVDTGADGQETIVEVEAEEQESVSETGRLFVRNLPYTARYYFPTSDLHVSLYYIIKRDFNRRQRL